MATLIDEYDNLSIIVFTVQCAELGFPTGPTALAYDPVLDLLAIGTRSGVIRLCA